MTPALKPRPDWRNAAQTLVSGCLVLDSTESRVQLMQHLCDQLGDNLYPAFLQILCVIGETGTPEAQGLVTETLVHALTTGRLPAGKLSAWGSNTLQSDSAFGQTRSLGPVEYLCSWYAQPSGRNPISAQAFSQSAVNLLTLISANADAKQLYCDKLLADIEDPIGGSLSSSARAAMLKMVHSWQTGATAGEVIDSYLNALQGNSLDRLAKLTQQHRNPPV